MLNEENAAAAAASGNSNVEVNRVAVKMPQFIMDDPEMWLFLVDRSFSLAGIVNEDTKFSYVLTSLEPRVVHEVRDIVMRPPANAPCTELRKALINRLSASQEQKTRRLLENEEMGDSKPSQLLRRLRVLAGLSVDDNLLRTLWTGRLPKNVQAILATQKQKPLDEVAELADAIMESIGPVASVCVAESANEDKYERLERQVAELTKEIAKLSTEGRRDRPRRSRSRSRARTGSSERSGLCWYHRCFGEKAKKCTQPCRFTTLSATTSGNERGSR